METDNPSRRNRDVRKELGFSRDVCSFHGMGIIQLVTKILTYSNAAIAYLTARWGSWYSPTG